MLSPRTDKDNLVPRATSAALFYFPTAVVQGHKFWDGGLANNNPVQEVWAEAQSFFRARPINCLISLGTGYTERKPKKSLFPVLGKGKKILRNVTNTELKHELVKEQAENQRVPYFRFNASTAQDRIGLADYMLLGALEEHTERFLDREDIETDIKKCAELLARRPDSANSCRTPMEDAGARNNANGTILENTLAEGTGSGR
ncbi:hypothetical protein H2201_008233 [Coniosporium apollinis]|uniref:PNPLA domain-containing protein n=1 Tax=Coniosporium apollinis TaxID=61459 RepID=A0ABQ9NHJ3_9PEZI|nr:hypothetical protein H2201_008233 [Coniosporium apollinis]